MEPTAVAEIRRLIAKAKRWDLVFSLIGLLALSLAVMVLVGLFVNLLSQGAPRISWEFFSNFSSRRAGSAGIAAAWVGTLLVMLVTALTAVPLGVSAGVYLEEYAPKNWLTGLIEINISNLAGVPSVVMVCWVWDYLSICWALAKASRRLDSPWHY